MKIWITIVLFALTANFANAQRNAEREQLVAEIRAYIAEVDSLINCRGCDAIIMGFHSSLILSRRARVLRINLPFDAYRGSGGGTSYSLYSNCPDDIDESWRVFDCEKQELIYSWRAFAMSHRITGKKITGATFTYYRNDEKVAEIILNDNRRFLPEKRTTTLYNNGRVIYRSSTRRRQ